MTLAEVPAGLRVPGAGRVLPSGVWRLLRLEFRRNPMIWMLPLLAVLFWVDTYRRATNAPPLWTVRSMTMQWRAMFEFVPLVAGVAAWTGSREGRRRTTDVVGVAARARWSRQLCSWAATTAWAEAAFLGCTAVLFGVTAAKATWGGPLWWPVGVGAATIAAATALGFTVGARLPSRFSPPLVVIAVLVLLVITHGAASSSVSAQLSPLTDNTLGAGLGILYPFAPDISITQLMFYGGLAGALLGAIGLPKPAGGAKLRATAATITLAGLAAAGTAIGLVGTSHATANGVDIPALHDAVSDRPIPYAPDCDRGGSAIPVCLHPALGTYLPALTAALDPLLNEVVGVPGAPSRVSQDTSQGLNNITFSGATIAGSPPVLHLVIGVPTDVNHYTRTDFVQPIEWAAAMTITTSVIGVDSSGDGNQAQQAVAAGLLQAADPWLATPGGLPHPGMTPPSGSATYAAAQRFAALPASSRHAWLIAHVAALRAGEVDLAQIP